MTDVYALVRERLCTLLDSAGVPCRAQDICLTARHCEASTARAIALGLDADKCVLALPEDVWISRAYAQSGHICFLLSHEFYEFALNTVNAGIALPDMPDNTDAPTDYALARMLMGARQGSPCIEDAEMRKLIWTALAILESKAALVRTADAAIRFGAGRSIARRDALADTQGEACACVARLIAYGAAAD